MNQKKVFETSILFLVVSLMFLPLIVTFNDFLTKQIERFFLYRFIQDMIVPYQAGLIGFIISPLTQDYKAYSDGVIVNGIPLRITWNCIGWQSLLMFIISLVIGLQGGVYTLYSKIQLVVIGLFGIFWINIIRMCLIVVLAMTSMPIFRVVFHDYLAAFVTIFYLFGFWWFAFRYILVTKINHAQKNL